jgi:hypothetical protein
MEFTPPALCNDQVAGHLVRQELSMHTRRTSVALRSTLAACTIALAISTGAAIAADAPQPAHTAPSKEMREKMATMHDKMAACLRSEKAVDTCHAEMMKACKESMGEKGCPMMGTHDHMMKDHPMGATDPK